MVHKKITVLGGGAWGTSIAHLLAENGYSVTLWCHEAEVARSIATDSINRQYLPGFLLNPNIKTTTFLEDAIKDASHIFEAIPVQFLRSILVKVKDLVDPKQTWVVLSKGIENDTLLFPGQIIQDVLGHSINYAVVSGPSFAYDLMNKKLTAVTVASQNDVSSQEIQKMLANDYFYTQLCNDIVGVQLGGALKNVIAIGIGILDSVSAGDNTKAFALTTGLSEMARCSSILGGKAQTVYGLSGVGDLVLTCTGKSSKNVAFGRLIGQGRTYKEIQQEIGMLPEGFNTAKSVNQLVVQHTMNIPVLTGIYDVVYHNKTVNYFLNQLMLSSLEG